MFAAGPDGAQGARGRSHTFGTFPPWRWPPSAAARKARRAGPAVGGASKVPSVRKRVLKLSGTAIVTGLCLAYLVWKINVRTTAHILANADLSYFLLAVG